MDMSGQVVLPGYIDAHAHWAGTPLLLLLLLQVGRVAAADSTMVLWVGGGRCWQHLPEAELGVPGQSGLRRDAPPQPVCRHSVPSFLATRDLGCTTANFTLFHSTSSVFAEAELVRSGKIIGPRVFSTVRCH